MTRPAVPNYGVSTLADLLPSLGAHLGVPGAADVLGLPDAQRYLLVLIDGLGWHQLNDHADHAPNLTRLAERWITSGVPSTTATSITSIGTGLAPGSHGIAGYSFWYPQARTVLNTLRWPSDLSGLDVQPQLTYFERLAGAGVRTSTIAPAHFAGSGLTTAALRGPSFLPVMDERNKRRRVELAVQACAAGERTLSYFYERQLDHAGHVHGLGSPQWLAELAAADALVGSLRAALPDDVSLVITGDHGMVNVPKDRRLLIEDEPDLMVEVTAFAGEGRFRQLMTPVPDAVASRWQDRLGAGAWVRTRTEAIAEGWFGDVSPRLADRFGDVLVAMADDGAVLSHTLPRELDLVGMHGSLTPAELAVPLLVA
ncbi:MAG TPA: nucleotide pyrophosphatase/phosphodiesterase family protein [Propionicimonas sp.]|uniref:alkaline phosphatase family protein n=1 Tax=Propionicimonas sp. TaxID=1955623 RepID=UPI002F40F028